MAETKSKTTKYFYAIGRRKNASATVRVYEGKGESTINGKPLQEIYPAFGDQKEINSPLAAIKKQGEFYFTVRVIGGGVKGQLGAVKLGLARALVKCNKEFKPLLKANDLLTRDARMVERKHTGFRKARKSEQFSKR